MTRRFLSNIAPWIVLAVFAPLFADAADGEPDRSFGTLEYMAPDYYTETGDRGLALSVGVQPDGKIIMSGTMNAWLGGPPCFPAAVRHHHDGAIDRTFGGEGVAECAQDYYTANGYAGLGQPDGKVLVAGWAGNIDPEIAV